MATAQVQTQDSQRMVMNSISPVVIKATYFHPGESIHPDVLPP